MNKIEARTSYFASSAILLSIALLIIVNYLALRHYKRFDLTQSEIYTLSQETKNVISKLKKPLNIYVFTVQRDDALLGMVKELLSRYEALNPKLVKVEYIDPTLELKKAEKLMQELNLAQAEVVIFKMGNDSRVVSFSELAEYEFSPIGAREIKSFKGELEFTRAILELIEEKKPKILFTEGHGELSLDITKQELALLQNFLSKGNFSMESWNPLGKEEVPPDTDLIIIASPKNAFTEQELAMLDKYLHSGGRILVLLDPALGETQQLKEQKLVDWLAAKNVKVGKDIVVDPSTALPFFGAAVIFSNNFGDHAIVKALKETKSAVLLPLVRSVTGGENATNLIMTTEEGWGEVNLENLESVEKDENDLEGPVTLAIISEISVEKQKSDKQQKEKEGKVGYLAVFGDSDFLTDEYLGQAGNATLVHNLFNFLVQREISLGIAPKDPKLKKLSLTPTELNTIRWIIMGLLPSIALVAGVYITWRRRR